MDKQEKIDRIVQDSEQLINNLAELKERIGSYGQAKEELRKTNEKLLISIEATQSLSEESHKVIQVMNDIGSGQIFDRLEAIENTQKKTNKKSTIFMVIIGVLLILQSVSLVMILKNALK